MILRIDRLQTEMPPPSDPDPAGAAVVQELLGGKFGEMSTFMNYTFQSFNFRNRQGARPFYDLVANIAAEEFGHIELVSTAINTMLTGAGEKGSLPRPADLLNPQHFAAGGAGTLVQDSNGKPWNGDFVTSTGDLVEDLVHNFFLETGARNGKLKVYEMVDHPAARALTGYLLVRGGVHQVAYARAVENLTGADLSKLFPSPRIPTEKIPECQPHIERGELAIGHFADLFDPDALTRWMLLNGKTEQRALYGLPMGQNANYVHVWKSLLEQAGFTLEDIPKQWEAFWAFWCDDVQPAMRRATGRDSVWAVGLSMSGETSDTLDQFYQFLAAYDADYVTPDGRLVIDDPEVRRRLIW